MLANICQEQPRMTQMGAITTQSDIAYGLQLKAVRVSTLQKIEHFFKTVATYELDPCSTPNLLGFKSSLSTNCAQYFLRISKFPLPTRGRKDLQFFLRPRRRQGIRWVPERMKIIRSRRFFNHSCFIKFRHGSSFYILNIPPSKQKIRETSNPTPLVI